MCLVKEKKALCILGITLFTTVLAYSTVILEDNSLAESGREATVTSFELKGEDVAPKFGIFDSTCPGRFGLSIATDSSKRNRTGMIAIGVPGRDAVLILEPIVGPSTGKILADNWIVDVDLHAEDTRNCYQQKEHFGTDVAMWGNWIAISNGKGKVYIYQKSRDGTRWDSRGNIDGAILEGWNEASEFGKRLKWFCKDGNLFLSVSAPKWYCRFRYVFVRWIFGSYHKRQHCGCVFIYKYMNNELCWNLIQTIYPPQEWSIDASSPFSWIHFGEAISLWNDSYFAVGAPGTACWRYKPSISRRKSMCGSLFLYKWDRESFSYLMEVQPHDVEGGDAFGSSLVSLYPFSLAVGAPRQDCLDGHLQKSSCGAVYLIDGCQDIELGRLRHIKKYMPHVQLGSFDLFGFAVEASEDGNLLLVSAPGLWHERGSVFLLKRANDSFAWTENNISLSRWLWKESTPFTNLGWQIRLLEGEKERWLLVSAPFAHFQQGSVYVVPFQE